MDFGSLLQTAKENEQYKKQEVRSYNTKFSPPKKEEKKAKALSANIQKFLARKEAEEKHKAQQAKRKKEELLALRSKDKKATRRVNVMLKRTKSANQSVIEDAVDKDNTAVTLVGPSQPDEDDYGYVSQEAAAFYNKMMEKYSKMPDEPKFPTNVRKASNNLSSTKDRVRAALEREKEEAMMPHKRKRKHKEDESTEGVDTKEDDTGDYEEPPAKTKPKPSAPPPMNFSELLKLAEQKQYQPIMIEVKPKDDEGPLMTKKQKREFERVQQWKERKQNGRTDMPENKVSKSENRIPKISSAQKTASDNPQKLNGNLKIDKIPPKVNDSVKLQKSVNKPEITANKAKLPVGNVKTSAESSKVLSDRKSVSKDGDRKSGFPSRPPSNSMASKPINKSISDPNGVKKEFTIKGHVNGHREVPRQKPAAELQPKGDTYSKKLPPNSAKPRQLPPQDFKSKPTPTSANVKPKQLPPKDAKPKQLPPSDLKPKQFPPSDIKSKQFQSSDIKPKQFPPSDLKSKQLPPKDLKPKQFPPPDVRRKEIPVKRKPQQMNKRRILDDEDYDSEMDDFIDDGPEDSEDYSKYIKDIFGYDKSKYRCLDDDDVDNMESSFAQQMREDIRSTKIGIMEDLEDIKREKEEKKRKAMMMKRRKL